MASHDHKLEANPHVVGGNRSRPRFRVQEAILILRQGKAHPQWREAAWHLIENSAKDTALLLEAQRDLLTPPEEPRPWWRSPYAKWLGGGLFLLMVGLAVWQVVLTVVAQCQ